MSALTAWPFVARSDEQDRFASVLARLGKHGGDASSVVIVEGLGGHGKSWLMGRFKEIAKGEVHSAPARHAPRRGPLVISLDWENESVSLTPQSTGPPLPLVLAKLYAAIVAEAGSGRLARRAVARAFRDFTAVLQGATDLPAVSANGANGTHPALDASTSAVKTGAKLLGDATAPPAGSLAGAGVDILAGVLKEEGAKARLADRIASAVRSDEMLVRAFASGLRKLSKRRQVVLLLDTCELIGAGVQWLRRASLAAGDNVVWVIAGRFEATAGGSASAEAAAFRRDLPEEQVRIIQMLPFDDETVKLLLATAETELAPGDEITAVGLTGGIPIAVYLVAKMLDGGRPIEEVLAPIDSRGDSTLLVRELAERYLKHVRTDPELGVDEHRLYGLALLHDDNLDADVLRALWGENGSMNMSLDELGRRHDFVLTPTHRLHAEVRATIRGYLLGTPRRSDVRTANERARTVLLERIDRIGQDSSYEDLLGNEVWRENVVALLWHSFWIDNGDGLALLAELLPGALFARPAFARDVVGVGTFFVSTLSTDQSSELRGCAGMLTFGSFVDQWLTLRKSAALKASGPLGRLLDDSARDDLDAATRLLRKGSSPYAPAAVRSAPPRAGLVALMAARQSPDAQVRLEHLQHAVRTLPQEGPYAREMVRVATELRDALRDGDARDPAARDRYLAAATVDAKINSEFDDADSLGRYALFLQAVPGSAEHAEELFERSLSADPDVADVLGGYAIFLKQVRRDYDRAAKMYERAIAADPSDADNFGNYAILLQEVRGDDDGAQDMYEQAIAADPNDANSLGNYANFLSEVRDDENRAQEMYERAIAAKPDDANSLGNYAVFLRHAHGDDDRAEKLYERALAANPSHTHNLRNYTAFLAGHRGDAARARTVYEQAIAADPRNADNLLIYATFLRTMGDHDRAAEMYEQAVLSDPFRADGLHAYVEFLVGVRNDPDRADAAFERAIAAAPEHPDLLGSYAVFLKQERQDYDRAEEMYERAIAAAPDHAVNLGNYAILLENVRGDADRAEELFERSIAAAPDHAANLGNYAIFLENVRGDADRAEEMYERSVAADPTISSNAGNYALFLQQVRKDDDRALEMYELAVAADPGANTLSNYGLLLGSRGDLDRAEEMHKRAIAANPDNPTHVSLYAIFLHKSRGATDRAAELHRQAVAATPPNPDSLGYYANFLRDARDDGAEEMFERAIAADPHANTLGNYARLLFELEKDATALEMAERAMAQAGPDHAPLLAELWLYLAALGPAERRDEALSALTERVDDGVRSAGWDFSRILTRARAEGNPTVSQLEQLAARISAEG